MQIVSIDELRNMIGEVTGDSVAIHSLTEGAPLLGSIPEMDSLAIVNLLVAMESKYQFQVEDDEVEQSIFQSLNSLRSFAQEKISKLNGAASQTKSN